MTARSSLRRRLRAARRQLSPSQRSTATIQINQALIQHPRYRRARTVALYLAHGGEVSVAMTIDRALADGKTVLLPRVFGTRLLFLPWQRGAPQTVGRYGIPRPARRSAPFTVRQIDLVIAPLVGFDTRNQRLGQGGGYYDRMFACRTTSSWQRPWLMGVAFGLQRVEKLPVQAWDVAMDTIIYDTFTSTPAEASRENSAQ